MADTYEQLRDNFRWNTPAQFNFGAAVDTFAADPNRVALLWEDQDGNRARLTFADIRDQSNRIANVLTALGIKRGDPVMIVLPRITLVADRLYRCAEGGRDRGPVRLDVAREGSRLPRQPFWRARDHRRALRASTSLATCAANAPRSSIICWLGAARTGWTSIQEAMQAASRDFRPLVTSGDEPAICYYTSGTTKEPKAVLHGHAYTWAHQFTGSLWLGLSRTIAIGPLRIPAGRRPRTACCSARG